MKSRWIPLIGIAAVGLTALAWSVRPVVADALQLNDETSAAPMALAATSGAGMKQEAGTVEGATVPAIVKPGGTEVLDAPNGALLLSLDASTMLTATGRSEDGQWIQIKKDAVEGWVAAADLIAINAEMLPVVEITIAAPTADAPSPEALATDAPTTDAPTTDAPTTDAQIIDPLVTETLITETPSTTTALPTLPAIVRGGGATLFANPRESDGSSLRAGTLLRVTGASEDGAWLAVETVATPVASGWVAPEQLIYNTIQSNATGTDSTANLGGNPLVSTIVSTTAASATPATDAPITDTLITDVPSTNTPTVNALTTVTVSSGANNLNLRALPGTANALVGKAEPGSEVALLGKTADGAWLQVLLDDGTTGWVASTYVTGDTSTAPVMEESITNAVATVASTLPTTDTPTATSTSPNAVTASVTGLTGTIVYQTSPGGTFYAYDLETGAQWPLTSGWDPAISPDGQMVAFVRGGGENGIWLIDIDGSNERLIYGERRDLSSPKWSPDGTYIVFGRGDSYITCRQIGRECLPDSVWLDRNPNMELDGFPLVDEYLQNLARIDIDGNNYRDLATLESAREPDWSSAGIVYASSDGLQITDDTEDAVNRVVYFEPLQARDQDPDWAGDRIVFITRQSSHYQIFSVNPDGTGKMALTRPVTTLVDQIPSNVAPAYSPDGTQIAFLSNRSENNEAGGWHLWVMNADGSGQRMLETIAPITYNFNNMEQAVSWGG